ncbi:OmpA family protein [Hymenobacter sp. HSC-4F20]|uniref:OmpA family protein n=1 Tax=Hymenobacter sp. HSC-4F20 TaxID=2864135 RepID=UPI001C735E69|nr:OmpA family protein [Hymenobacter sp. HSC-4F20]MBX0291749.1 OmpA family protein [Hymenobacter sp. HSC-4F20]
MPPRIPLSKALTLGLSAWALAPLASQAQTADRKTAIGINVSAMQYKGNFGSDYWNWSENKYAPGITISQYLSKGLDLQLSGNYVEFKKNAPAGAPYFGSNFATNVVNVNLGLKFKLLKEESFLRPYLLAAPGWTYTSREGTIFRNNQTINTDQDKSYFDLFGAAGLDFRLGEAVHLFVQTGQHIPLKANLDGDPARDDNSWDDKFLQHTVGLNVALGKVKDEDNDGVADRKDKCPGTPAGVAVDANGCPLDGDGDGVPDYQDKCPTEKGLASLEGCPDRDGDGVRDGDDKCPDTPGKAELQGCPDSDNDGVIDQNDKCPDTPGGVKVDANGCPVDSDGDGVPDYQDRCPQRPGPASNKGCPEMKIEEKKRLQEATKYIQFEFNKATLKPISFPTLDGLVQILNDYPDYFLGISAHADNVGNDDYNLRLSDERAASARAYMLRKGIPENRIVSHGYGESKPIAPNTTEAGRALNRRVEFDVYLPGDPNPAETKYGPAPEIPAAPVKAATPAKKAPAKKAPVRRPASRR